MKKVLALCAVFVMCGCGKTKPDFITRQPDIPPTIDQSVTRLLASDSVIQINGNANAFYIVGYGNTVFVSGEAQVVVTTEATVEVIDRSTK